MKQLLTILIVMLSFSLFAQEKGVSPIIHPTIQPSSHPATYAVVVGISNYQDEGIPDLRFADKDAEAFAGFLQSPAGGSLDEDHLKVLINHKATVAQFAIALDWLWEVVKEDDRVIIYFSGHGDVERKSITQPGYLLCWDAPSRVYMAGGAFNVRDLNDVVSTLSVQNKAKVILVTDACRAGKLSGSGIGGSQATAANLAKQYANEIKILSCQPDEYSIEGEQWGGGRGAFSYHLLDGLNGMADRNTDQSVTLMEIRGYLEEKVSVEVAPHNQLPMVVGNGREKLTDVFPKILAQLKAGKKSQMQLFTATESRGIEDDVLAALSASGAEADSNIVEMYLAFKESLSNKNFLEPADACAELYYTILSEEPQLGRLHSSMRRNYAAALQDDAQQVMNTMLKSGLIETILNDAKSLVNPYYNYPKYLERAGGLLGEDHYMYKVLQARKHFFEGMTHKKRKDSRIAFRQALSWQPDMAHAMVYLIRRFEAEQKDSAEYYFKQATTLIPSWVEPYLALGEYYHDRLKQPNKQEEMLNRAGQLDSASVLVWFKKAAFYGSQNKLDLAEKWYVKTVQKTSEDICFPCAHNNLGTVYYNTQRYDLAEHQLKKAIQLDSNFSKAYNNLGMIYLNNHRYDLAEHYYKKAIQFDSTNVGAYEDLGLVYFNTRHYAEAEKHLIKSIQLDSTRVDAYLKLGNVYKDTRRYDLAEQQYKKSIQLDSTNFKPYSNLGLVYFSTRRYGLAEQTYKKTIQLNSTFWMPYANLGVMYQSLQRWEESEKMVQKSIEYGPPIGELVVILGNSFTHLPGRLEDAKKTLDKGLKMSPNNPDAFIYLAQWSIKKNQMGEAWQYLEQGLEKGFGNGQLERSDLQEGPDFEGMRKERKWEELMMKYFPEESKD